MAVIQVLNNETVDKIAAGEVVERPASVVKELVENAIDAGATAITVEIKEGGIVLIRVTDNGSGIEKAYIRSAFLRHATSKIKSVEDLSVCASLGFRGEALSSIAAVSMVEVITKDKTSLTGIRYTLEGGATKEFEDIGAPLGTTIIVRNLFFNTPARKKFLKTPQTEGGYVSDLMEHMAMSMPQISFKYLSNGQVKFHTSGNGDAAEIIYRIYGKEVKNALLYLSLQSELIAIEGYIGKPSINRANRNFENYFINHRYIKNDSIAKALEEAYKPYLMQHKFPFTVLYITMNPAQIDVNVHPAKMEVRFSNQKEVFDAILEAVRMTLSGKELIPAVTLGESTQQDKPQDIVPSTDEVPEPFEVNRIQAGLLREEAQYGAKTKDLQDFLQKVELPKVLGAGQEENSFQNAKNNSNIIKAKDRIIVEKPTQLEFFEEKLLTCEAKNEYKILGQLFATYWVMEWKDKVFFIDQHAAHEKVKYERLLKQTKEKEVLSQNLNPPIIVTLSGKEEAVWNQYEAYFEELGFKVEVFGGNEYALRSVPFELYGKEEKQLFENLLDELTDSTEKSLQGAVLEKIASMACKAAVKGNQAMKAAEFQALMDELLTLENPYHCPHGRPTMISMSKYEIERKFKRIL